MKMMGITLMTALLAATTGIASANEQLLRPHMQVVDPSLSTVEAESRITAARRYGSFWSSGDEALARAALAPDFTDRTLPPGRAQGLSGPLAASRFMRAAIPDLRAEIEQLIVTGDRVVVHLRFQGHFTGTFKGVQGKGQAVNFIATDIYRIVDGRIADNWHIEDNLALLQQLGVIGG